MKGLNTFNFLSTDYSCSKIVYLIIFRLYSTTLSLSSIVYMLGTLLYFLHKVPLKKKLLRESPSIASKVALNPLFTRPVRDSNLTWMKFPSEYTGGGSFWPQILKSLGFPPWEATFVIKTRALSAAAPAQSSFSPATRVKFKKVSLMIFPPGTVIFQVHILLPS